MASALASVVPGPLAREVAEAAGVVASHIPGWPGKGDNMAGRRHMVQRHLRRVLGPAVGRLELARLVDETFASYARYWAESLRLPSLPPARVESGIAYDGFALIEESARRGQGTILALPHLGGWEWGGTHLAMSGFEISVVVERLEPPEVFEWFAGFRESLGMHVIPVGPGAAAQCARALKDNHLLCLLCDRVVGGSAGVDVEFFGETTQLPAGPATLALRTGATLLPCAVYFGRRSEEHQAVVKPALGHDRTGRLRDDVERLTQDLAHRLEELIRHAPTQWHLMQANWPSDTE